VSFDASIYLNDIVWPSLAHSRAIAAPLSHYEASVLQRKLAEDGIKSLYSALVSIADAINSLENSFYSWSVVKLYYSVFYALRSYLAFNDVCVFYSGSSPKWAIATPGKLPQNAPKPNGQKGSNNTHKVIMNLFEHRFPRHVLLSQEIEGIQPLHWLQTKREEVNYRLAKFSEPACPSCFKQVQRVGIRRLISSYVNDETFIYTFDPDHALLAYPIEVVKQLQLVANAGNFVAVHDSDRVYLRDCLSDSYGPIGEIVNLLKL
jgi:hypothetical protein